MKKIIYSVAVTALLFSCTPRMQPTQPVVANYNNNNYTTPPPNPNPNYVPTGYETFYNELSPYGTWIDYPGQGYVWLPNVDPGFRPYATNGQWVYTNYGWTWASNYSWGWAPFHYGRWLFDDNYGWLWVPGHEWSPAWVTWGQSGEYYGWAPLAPNVNANSAYNGGWTPPQHYWNFVPAQHITEGNVNNYVVNNTNNVTVVNNITKNVTIINNTTTVNNTHITNNNITNNNVTNNNIVNNNVTNNNVRNNNTTVYNNGPRIEDVEKNTNIKIQQVTINQSTKPGAPALSNNQLSIYSPTIKENNSNNKPVPAKVVTYKSATPVQPAQPVHPNQGTVTNPQNIPGQTNAPAVIKENPSTPYNPQVKPLPNQQSSNVNGQTQNSKPAQPPVQVKPVQNNNAPIVQKPVQAPPKTNPVKPVTNPKPVITITPANQNKNNQPVKPGQKQKGNQPKKDSTNTNQRIKNY